MILKDIEKIQSKKDLFNFIDSIKVYKLYKEIYIEDMKEIQETLCDLKDNDLLKFYTDRLDVVSTKLKELSIYIQVIEDIQSVADIKSVEDITDIVFVKIKMLLTGILEEFERAYIE